MYVAWTTSCHKTFIDLGEQQKGHSEMRSVLSEETDRNVCQGVKDELALSRGLWSHFVLELSRLPGCIKSLFYSTFSVLTVIYAPQMLTTCVMNTRYLEIPSVESSEQTLREP